MVPTHPSKQITILVSGIVSGQRMTDKLKNRLRSKAQRLVGDAPFHCETLQNEFLMYFGLDSVASAVTARHQLQELNFGVEFWTGADVSAMDDPEADVPAMDVTYH